MKTKLILLACISVTFASCKKDAVQSAQPQSPTISMNEQIADLIKRADKNLYDEVYNQNSTRATPVVTTIPGYYRIPGQGEPGGGSVDDGYCFQVPGVCMVVVTSGAGRSGDPLVSNTITGNVTKTYSADDNARLIENTSSPVVQNIAGLSTTINNNGDIQIKITKIK